MIIRSSHRFRDLSIMLLAFALVFSVNLAANPASAISSAVDPFGAFPTSVSGDYVVYRDYTWEQPTWVGFLYYDDSTYGAFVMTPSTGVNVSLLFSVEIADGKMVLTGQNIISKISQDDVLAVNYLMRLLPDLYSWRMDARRDGSVAVSSISGLPRSTLLPPVVKSAREIESFGGSVSLVFAPEVSLFGLWAMTAADGNPVLDLARMGRVQSGGDTEFFSFTPMGETKEGSPLAIPANREEESKTVDGITLKLDGQWTMIADNTLFLGNSAVLIVDTIDLSLMQIPRENLPLSMVRLFSLSNASSWSIPSEIAVDGDERRFTVRNLFYDTETGTLNRDIKTCIPSADGKKCTIVSLSVAESAWKTNRVYFESLF